MTAPPSDREAIRDVVLRYCRGIDRLDLDLVRAAYHPGALDHHTGFSGPVEDYLEWVAAAVARFRGTMHIVGNQLVEIRGDDAVCESYGTAVHWGDPPEDPAHNFTSGFRYVDHMQRRDGRWAISERWAVREWTRSDAGRFTAKEAEGPAGTRDGTDVLHHIRAVVGVERPPGAGSGEPG
jgi:hypothetical protein